MRCFMYRQLGHSCFGLGVDFPRASTRSGLIGAHRKLELSSCVSFYCRNKGLPIAISYRVISTSLPPDAVNRALCALTFISFGEQ